MGCNKHKGRVAKGKGIQGRYAVAGNPEDCVARLREYIGAGARTIILNSACPSAYTEENERLLASGVLSAFR